MMGTVPQAGAGYWPIEDAEEGGETARQGPGREAAAGGGGMLQAAQSVIHLLE